MKIGSKLALYKLKLEHEGEKGKVYKATAVENFQAKTPYGNIMEQQFINNIIIYTDLDLEIANFDKELQPKVIKKKDGTSFEIKQPALCFERISNPDKSIITVLDFEYKVLNGRNKQGNILYTQDKKPYINSNFYIYKCIYGNQKYNAFELKDLQRKYQLLERKYNLLITQNKELKSENKKLSKQKIKISDKEKPIKTPKPRNVIKKPTPIFVEVNGASIAMPTFDNDELI